jgi:hypothetical protein
LQNNEVLTIEDFGAGSRTGLTKQRKSKRYCSIIFKTQKICSVVV